MTFFFGQVAMMIWGLVPSQRTHLDSNPDDEREWLRPIEHSTPEEVDGE